MDNLAVGHMTGVKAKQRSNGISFYWKLRFCIQSNQYVLASCAFLISPPWPPPNSFNRKLTKATSSGGSRTTHRCTFCKRSLCFLVCTPDLQGEDVTHFPPKNHCPAVIPSENSIREWELRFWTLVQSHARTWQAPPGTVRLLRVAKNRVVASFTSVFFSESHDCSCSESHFWKLARNWPANDPLLHHFVFSQHGLMWKLPQK